MSKIRVKAVKNKVIHMKIEAKDKMFEVIGKHLSIEDNNFKNLVYELCLKCYDEGLDELVKYIDKENMRY